MPQMMAVIHMIYSAKQKAEYQVNTTIIDLYWEIGRFVSEKTEKEGWGKGTVKELSDYILSKERGLGDIQLRIYGE